MTDQAIYDMMTTIKDGWHHFHSDDREGSLKNIARRVFGVVKQYSNPDLDLDAIVEETWLDQSFQGSFSMYPSQEEEDSFDEYVTNWKYPRKENK